MNRYLGLVHHPIVNKRGDKVTTSVTNLDIHDIARSCRTFNFKNYFLVTPITKQTQMIDNLLGFWKKDFANDYNPDRYDALSSIRVAESIQEAIVKIEEIEGVKPLVVVTGAQMKEAKGSVSDLEQYSKEVQRPIFLLFGTGWGLHIDALNLSDYRLNPIFGSSEDGYNHLSVRSAVAIYLSQFS